MLATLFGSQLRAKLLGWLMTHPDERYFVRQIAGIIHEDSTNVSRELKRLSQAGILSSSHEGRQKYFQANRDCPLFGELRSMAVKTFGLADILRAALLPHRNCIRMAFIYGSFASGRDTTASDIDVMVIGDIPFGDVVQALKTAEKSLGREINPTVYPVGEYVEKVSNTGNFLNRVLSGKKIYLIGDDDEFKRLEEKSLD